VTLPALFFAVVQLNPLLRVSRYRYQHIETTNAKVNTITAPSNTATVVYILDTKALGLVLFVAFSIASAFDFLHDFPGK
jgi:hypothetical protein